jgi:hypothetical protein
LVVLKACLLQRLFALSVISKISKPNINKSLIFQVNKVSFLLVGGGHSESGILTHILGHAQSVTELSAPLHQLKSCNYIKMYTT